MGLDPLMLMGLLTGGGNLMGQAGNLAAQGMGMADTMWDAGRYFQRNSDPTINDIRNYNVNRFNSNQYGPYGDIEGSFGNMFGTRQDGSPVTFGDMAASQTNYMLNNNPATAALAQLQSASSMQRPQMPTGIDMMSGDASRAMTGYPPRQAMPSAQPPQMAPPTMPSTALSGVAAPSGPNPTISSPTPGPGSAARQGINDMRNGIAPNGQMPQLPMGGQGAQAAGGMAQNFVQQRGGLPALLQAMRQPGSAMMNLRDFAGFGRPRPGSGGGGGGNANTDFWNSHGNVGGRMPSYAVGTPYVPQTGPAMLHRGEAVIPRQMNPNLPGQAGQPYRQPQPLQRGGYDGSGIMGGQQGKFPGMPMPGQVPRSMPPQPMSPSQMGQPGQYAPLPSGGQHDPRLRQPGGQYDPTRGLPPGAQSFGGAKPMPQGPQAQPLYSNPLQAQAAMAKTNPTQPLQPSVVPNGGKGGGKKGKKGQGGGVSNTAPVATNPNAKLPVAPVDPNAKLPTAGQGGGVSGGVSGTTPGASQGETGQQTQGPAPIDAGRVDLVQNLLNNPESMSQDWQRVANQQFADAYDTRNQDQMRQMQERMASSGLGDSGIMQDQMFRGDLARQSNLLGAQRDISQQAALTNFGDRQQVANLALAHQLGIGNMGLQNAQFQNQMYNQDRQYNLQYAQALAGLGGQAQQQQSGLLGQLGGLIGSGLGYNDQLLNLIYGQGMQRYADPNVSAVPQTGYAPNPYLDFLASQNQQDSGGSDMWGTVGTALGAGLGAFL